jgi:radical SAM protein with 4Fe4S-binding SPASM domain
MNQINIHILVSENTFDWIMETLKDRLIDPRLAKLNAIVLLSLKQRGRGKSFTPLSTEKFKQVIDFAFANGIGIGFDSCSCFRFLKAIEGHEKFDMLYGQSEPCESSLMSAYVDVDGNYFPCSFTPDYGGWDKGVSVVDCQDFVRDVWNNPKVEEFRKKLLATKGKNKFQCRTCPLFEIENKKE